MTSGAPPPKDDWGINGVERGGGRRRRVPPSLDEWGVSGLGRGGGRRRRGWTGLGVEGGDIDGHSSD